jgi:hypothetical protein
MLLVAPNLVFCQEIRSFKFGSIDLGSLLHEAAAEFEVLKVFKYQLLEQTSIAKESLVLMPLKLALEVLFELLEPAFAQKDVLISEL